MCKNLVERGRLDKPLIIFNRTTKRAEDLCSKIGHSTVASSIEDAVLTSEIIFICMGDDIAVRDTVDHIIRGNIK